MAQLDPEGIRSRIREARKSAGLTQQELADALEIHKRTVENYERFRTPDYRMLNRIASITNRPLEWFLHGQQAEAALPSDLREELAEAVSLLAEVAPRFAAAANRQEATLDAMEALLSALESRLAEPRSARASSKPRQSG